MEAVFFYAFAVAIVGAGLAILLSTKIVHAATWLLAALGGVAGLFLLLEAQYVAAIQVIVYVGGVLVLIVFGVMLTTGGKHAAMPAGPRELLILTFVGPLLLAGLITLQFTGPWQAPLPVIEAETDVRALGRELLTTWLLPFEVLSVLLLAVMIGAAYLARPEKR